MLTLASSKSAVHTIAAFFDCDPYSATARGFILALAISCLFGLYVFIQPLQAGVRSLIVDTCPAYQQSLASAWASRLTGAGNIVGYLFGFVPVRTIFPYLNITQFSWLCLVAAILLSVTVLVTCYFIIEPDPKTLPSSTQDGTSFMGTFRHIVWSIRTMPPTVRQVCVVQFFAWLGWFPYLFYISSYVGDLCGCP